MLQDNKKNLCAIADAVIDKIKKRKNPFDKITLIFHSTQIAQWFKAYYLKKENSILMNVECKTLSSFINDTINPKNENHVLTASEYREYIIRALLDNLSSKSYYYDGLNVNGINLYEYADKLSTIIFNMEFDNEEIGITSDSDFEKKIYESANELAKKQNCYTPKQMYIQNKNRLNKTDGDIYLINNSFISNLYIEILKKYDSNITVFSFDESLESNNHSNIELYAAHSKMREVERLHSDICKKIDNEKDVLINDFVVYAPNINDYANTIRRVFHRSAPGFPEVPFRIIGERTEKHDMISALSILHQIANKGFFTRYDLLKMMKIPMFMNVKGITSDDVQAFMDVIEATNTHRNNDTNDDWEYFRKRLLTSILADGKVCLPSGCILTYSNIDMDVTRINRLIDIINDFSTWSKLFEKTVLSEKWLTSDDRSSILSCLKSMFSTENQYGEEKNYFFSDVKKEVETIQNVFGDSKIPALTFLLLLQDAPTRFSSSAADVFAGGVTFLSLDIDNIVSEKYVYVLGLSSKNFPRIEKKNEIDFSKNHKYTYDLDKIAFKNLMACSENLAVSYINIDLQTDEKFFPSSVIPANCHQNDVSFDEYRDLDELYTWRELQNKSRVGNIGAENDKPNEPNGFVDDSKTITTSQIKKFLENPIVYKYSQMCKDSEDEDSARTDEFENIDLGGLKEYSVVKEMILAAVRCKEDGSYYAWNEVKENIFEGMLLTKKLPNLLEPDYFQSLYESKAQSVINEIINGYKKVESSALSIGDYILEMNSLCYLKEDNDTLSFIEPRGAHDNVTMKDYLLPYVCALAVVAAKNDGENYSIVLKSQNDMHFQLSSTDAQNTLKKIIIRMHNVESSKYMDIELYSDIFNEIGERDIKSIDINTLKKVPKSIEELSATISQHNSWKYFNDKQMLDPNVDFGFDSTKESIAGDILAEYSNIREVVLFGREKQK